MEIINMAMLKYEPSWFTITGSISCITLHDIEQRKFSTVNRYHRFPLQTLKRMH